MRRGRRCDVMRTRRRRCHDNRGGKHGKEKRRAVVAGRTVYARSHADAAAVHAAGAYGHAAGNVRTVRVVGAAGESNGQCDGKKPELHGCLLAFLVQKAFGK